MKYSALLRITTPPMAALWLIVALLLADSVAALAQPWIAGRVTEHLIARDLGAIRGWLLLWLLVLAVKAVLGFGSQYLVGSVGERMAARLRTRVYEHLQVLPMAFYHQRKQGEVLALLTRDAEVISQFITTTVVTVLPWLATFIGALVMMLWLDPLIALLALVLLPVYYVAMKLIGRRIRPISSAWIESWSQMYAFVEENLGLLAAIKAFVREPLESRRFADRNSRLLSLSRRQIRVQAVLTPAVGFLAGAGLLLLVWVGAGHVEDGRLDTAALVSLLLYAMLLTRPISGLAGVYGQVQRTRGAADRLLACFAEQPEPDESGGQQLQEVAGRVRFEGVSYAYPGRDRAVSGIDLDIAAGETVAIVGPNGAGKSTLAWLLLRYADPDDGRILIDDTDVASVRLASLRARIGLVAQHTLLLNGTARDNIGYGRLDATEAEIEAAAKAAGAHEFIRALPEGYDTVIGDQGIRLSGGQRQRLSLARTLLKDPPVIILDEATAMFDPQGEEDFLARCSELLARRTVIMITHRPVSLSLADRVLRMEDGRIV